MKYLLFTILIISSLTTNAQSEYTLYSKKGKQVTFEDLIKDISKHDITLFGEYHDSKVVHELQLKTIRYLDSISRNVKVGMEMFEVDNQEIINEYFAGLFPERNFKEEARFWSNYEEDYKPILEHCKTKKIPLIATNIPRRYASAVYRHDLSVLDSLDYAHKWLPILPMPYDSTLSQYSAMSGFGNHGSTGKTYIAKAQAVKDATMATNILKHIASGDLFVHLNGAYHSDFYQGILWYLSRYSDRKLKTLTISTVHQKDIGKLEKEHKKRADYIIVLKK